jgi:hypothetical protein
MPISSIKRRLFLEVLLRSPVIHSEFPDIRLHNPEAGGQQPKKDPGELDPQTGIRQPTGTNGH